MAKFRYVGTSCSRSKAAYLKLGGSIENGSLICDVEKKTFSQGIFLRLIQLYPVNRATYEEDYFMLAVRLAEEPRYLVAGSHRSQRAIALPPLQKVWIRDAQRIRGGRVWRRGIGRVFESVNGDQPFRIGKSKRPQQNSVDQAEDRRCPADAPARALAPRSG
jgi:hypothetical protein